MNNEISYLGHHFDAKGIHTSKVKVQAIDSFPIPTNKNLQHFVVWLNTIIDFYLMFQR